MPVQFRDYYQTLGVQKSATQDEIKSAFRKLARKYHPDTAEDKKSAEEKFKEINEAYEVLGEPENRKKYDDLGPNWQQGPRPSGDGGMGGGFDPGGGTEFHFGGTGFSDFFEQIFGARRGGMRGYSRGGFDFEEAPERGRDVEADLLVSLEEALHGSTRQISFRRGDSGKVQTYTVKIPKGVREGQRIRLAGQGGEGEAGAGDLYLRMKFERHPDFDLEGPDLFYDLEVSVEKAVLGAEVQIPTLEGPAKLHLPEGTQNGQKFRLSRHGMAKGGGERGDLYAVVSVTLPRNLSVAQRKLWEQIATI